MGGLQTQWYVTWSDLAVPSVMCTCLLAATDYEASLQHFLRVVVMFQQQALGYIVRQLPDTAS